METLLYRKLASAGTSSTTAKLRDAINLTLSIRATIKVF